MDVNGEAIFGTHPWQAAEGKTSEGLALRFTARRDTLYAILLENPGMDEVTLSGLVADRTTEIMLLGNKEPLKWENTLAGIRVQLPGPGNSPAYTLRLTPQPQRSVPSD